MSLFHGAILGVIQGLGEFLPISSSGHLLLCRLLLGIQEDTPAMKMLDILLHVGTLLPVLIVFRKDWVDMILHPLRNKTLILLVIASLPTLAVYVLAGRLLPSVGGFHVFDSGWFLGVSFLISSLFLLLCDVLSRSVRRTGDGRKVGVGHALLMGLFQGIGMIPGISRSGSTILGGVSSGLNKTTAAKFSFMMSAPAIAASLLVEGKDALEEGYISQIEFLPTVVGVILAAVVGYLAIRFMLRIISRVPLSWFALYLAVIGIVFLLLQYTQAQGVPALAVPVAVPVS